MPATPPSSDNELDIFARLMQNAPYPVVICNAIGQIVSANAAAQSLYGPFHNKTNPDDWHKLAEVRDEAGNKVPPHRYPLARALGGEIVLDETFTVSSRADGKTRLIKVTAHQLRNGGRVVGAISLHRF